MAPTTRKAAKAAAEYNQASTLVQVLRNTAGAGYVLQAYRAAFSSKVVKEDEALWRPIVAAGVVGPASDKRTALMAAAATRAPSAHIRRLLGPNPQAALAARDSEGLSALDWAASTGNASVIVALAERGADLDARCPGGCRYWYSDSGRRTALHRACMRTDGLAMEVAVTLLQLGADPLVADERGETALHIVCAKQPSRLDLAAALLDHAQGKGKGWAEGAGAGAGAGSGSGSAGGAEAAATATASLLNATTRYGETPLDIACDKGHVDLALLLIGRGAGVTANTNKYTGRTALMRAAFQGLLPVVQALVAAGADAHSKDENGYGPLHLACIKGSEAVVQYLLSLGVSATEAARGTDYGQAPLHLAAKPGNLGVIKALVQQGKADVNVKDKVGRTPLHCLCSKGEADDVGLWLMQAGAKVDARDGTGMTPLLRLAMAGNALKLAAALLQHGADPNARDEDGYAPLHWACTGGQDALATLLHEHGADPGALTASGYPDSAPEYHALDYGHTVLAAKVKRWRLAAEKAKAGGGGAGAGK